MFPVVSLTSFRPWSREFVYLIVKGAATLAAWERLVSVLHPWVAFVKLIDLTKPPNFYRTSG